jgi:hypothetical protein
MKGEPNKARWNHWWIFMSRIAAIHARVQDRLVRYFSYRPFGGYSSRSQQQP